MRAIIMAGGFGTRLRPLTINIPKPMVPVGNIPMMEHVVSLLAEHGITDVCSLLYFQPETIRNHFKDGSAFGVKMTYAQPDDDYGTAGAVRYALKEPSEPVLIISGDLITDFDLTEAIKWHEERKADATILLTRVENPLAYGIVITEDDGRIVRFLEKPSWGEAFSDTINTGIYLLQPSAIELIPYKENYDFSQNLYPLMLSKNMGLYGKIAEGYWKDVGNVDEYRLAHHDLYTDAVKLDLKLEPQKHGEGILYAGENTTIEDDVEIRGKVILGHDVVVGSGSKLHNCTVGHRVKLGPGTQLHETTVWPDAGIGGSSECSTAIVCSRAQIGERVHLFDNVIVSDDCTIGRDATVKANCKIWPNKQVEDGAIVSHSIVWGEKWNRELFTDSKVTGLALSEITPEMCVRLGAAFGASLGRRASVVTSRDGSDLSRLLRRSFISGLLAAGVNVSDLETMPIPAVRYALNKGEYSAGMYVRHNPGDYRLLDIIVFDGNGLDMPTGKLKKIERNYFGEDFERATIDTIGHLDRPQRLIDDYRHDFMREIDRDLIRNAGFKIVVDHSNGASSQIFPNLFTQLGVSAVELNAALNPRKFSTTQEAHGQAVVQLSAIVKSLNADFGVQINPAAEKVTLVDEEGQPLDPQLFLLVVTKLFLQTARPRAIAVPINASMGTEVIAKEHKVEVIRVPSTHRDMMEAIRSGQAEFVAGTRGGFIFPGFQTGADALVAIVKLMEMLASTNSRIGELRRELDRYARQSISVPCPWSKKMSVMRQLITDSAKKERELVEGVRIFENGGWVLVAPDRSRAAFTIMAESTDEAQTARLVEQYKTLVEECQKS